MLIFEVEMCCLTKSSSSLLFARFYGCRRLLLEAKTKLRQSPIDCAELSICSRLSLMRAWNRSYASGLYSTTSSTCAPAFLSTSAACACVACVKSMPFTLSIWSPLRNSPLESAAPPLSMNETNMPSPPSPPTMLKPKPCWPLCK